MPKKKRTVLLSLIAVILLLLGLIFRQYVMDDIVMPVALVFWLLLRIFVLSIDQSIYWGVGILLVVVYVFYRMFQGQSGEQLVELPDPNPILNNLEFWRASIMLTSDQGGEKNALKQEIISLLVSMYSSHHPDSANFQIYDALRQGQIPLPERVQAFLFNQKPEEPQPSLFKDPVAAIVNFFPSIHQVVHNWIRQRTGRDRAEYYQAIEEVLEFMENSLEMKHDDESYGPHAH
jgi:Ca2+/Na+ antiporter